MAVDATKVSAFVQALVDKFENKVANKKTDISGDFTSDTVSYPTVQAVKSWVNSALGSYASSSHTHGNVSNDGKIGTASGKIVTTGTSGALQASDSITKSQISDFPSSMTPSSHSHGDISNDGKLGSTSGKIVTTGTGGKLQASETITKSLISDFPSTMTPSSHSHGSINNAGAIGSASGKIITTGTSGVLQASDSITKSQISDFPSSMTPSSHAHGNITNAGKIGSTSGLPVITGTGGLVTTGIFGSTAGTFAEGNHTHSQYLTSHQSLDGKTVTVEEQSTAETGFAKTYVVKQGGSQVGSKINIPKDFLVKSGQVKSCTTANSPVSGYAIGDKYIDFVINSKDGSATDEHMYILVKDLVEDTTYTADGTTLQLSNGQFKVKNGGIGTTQLASGVVTSLGYADAFHSSPAAGITSTQISNWDAAAAGGLTISDVDGEIEDYLDAITTALS